MTNNNQIADQEITGATEDSFQLPVNQFQDATKRNMRVLIVALLIVIAGLAVTVEYLYSNLKDTQRRLALTQVILNESQKKLTDMAIANQVATVEPTDQFTETGNEELQSRLLAAYYQQSDPVNPVYLRIINQADNFVRGEITSLDGLVSFDFIAMQNSDKSVEIIRVANEITPCSLVEEYDIPKAIYGDCIED